MVNFEGTAERGFARDRAILTFFGLTGGGGNAIITPTIAKSAESRAGAIAGGYQNASFVLVCGLFYLYRLFR